MSFQKISDGSIQRETLFAMRPLSVVSTESYDYDVLVWKYVNRLAVDTKSSKIAPIPF